MRISMCQPGILGTAHGMFKDYVWVGVVSWAVPDNCFVWGGTETLMTDA